jgi:hypothetical protein
VWRQMVRQQPRKACLAGCAAPCELRRSAERLGQVRLRARRGAVHTWPMGTLQMQSATAAMIWAAFLGSDTLEPRLSNWMVSCGGGMGGWFPGGRGGGGCVGPGGGGAAAAQGSGTLGQARGQWRARASRAARAAAAAAQSDSWGNATQRTHPDGLLGLGHCEGPATNGSEGDTNGLRFTLRYDHSRRKTQSMAHTALSWARSPPRASASATRTRAARAMVTVWLVSVGQAIYAQATTNDLGKACKRTASGELRNCSGHSSR